ncbi:DEAD/DEAH box helicase [Chitinilyticum litopenaei]|uniref:DEAD/DEAH box helicase n=1 Tax=Chitinilyticum litopenaei TaxID=1121276 RepID=UPI001B7FC25D|nr:DEAD/DEAH box helicase [Chitinilyticum litopenaei]
MSFSSLGLSPELAAAASQQAWLLPTAIQCAAIPLILRGGDLRAAAQTGSGKTGAFALPLLQRWQAQGERALVLVPTRELAVQVADEFVRLAAGLARKPKVRAVYGGASVNAQMQDLRGVVDVLVATPGRLLDLIGKHAVRPATFGTLVLDEADRLLDLGFSAEIAAILGMLPAQRQSLLFSATFPPAVAQLAQGLLQEPECIDIVAGTTPPAIQQRAINVDTQRRTALLLQLLTEAADARALVFAASKQGCEQLARELAAGGVLAAPFHGELSQGRRNQVLDGFKAGRLCVLVATDLAGRGIDIDGLPLVVNYDLPRSPVDYTHRIGRTARAGLSGTAISLIGTGCEAHFRLIEKRLGMRVPREQIAGFEPVAVPLAVANAGGVKGARMSKKDKLRAAAAREQLDKN